MTIRIETNICTGCGDCITACPFGLIEIVNDKATIGEGCTLCGACRDTCQFEAITIEETDSGQVEANKSYQGVWVYTETKKGRISNVGYELVSKGRELADTLNTELAAVCFGHDVAEIDKLIAHGADKVYLADDPTLADRQEDLYTGELVRLVNLYKPEIVLAGATSLGRAFIPRVAAILDTGLTADCTGLEIDTESQLLKQTRPTFGGNVMATIICPTRRPQMATVRPRVFPRNNPDIGRLGEIIKVDFDNARFTPKSRLLDSIDDVVSTIKFEDADIIVAGGRGLGKPENFSLLEELAQELGAALATSRPPVDEGWIPYVHQVGQTGQTVSPKLYIACGISGAVQHLAGMQSADIIVAINNDPDAPIFEVATYGIIGDIFEVIPSLLTKLREAKQ